MRRDDLQGVRGLAIISVLGFHFFPNVFPNGYIGVDMFFVLSGFLMTMVFGSKTVNWQTIQLFYYQRIKRILPLYLLGILIGCLSIFFIFPSTFISTNMDSAWSSTFLYHNFAKNSHFQVTTDMFTVTWSICVQMQFYLLAPLLFFTFSSSSDGRLITFYHLALILGSLSYQLCSVENVAFNSVFSRLWQFSTGFAVFFLSEKLLELDNRESKPTESTGLLTSADENDPFEKWEEIVIFEKPAAPRRNLNRFHFELILFCALCSLLGFTFCLFSVPEGVLRVSCTFLTGILILVGSICEVNPLGSRALIYLGNISYSLFLVHWPIFVYIKHFYEDQLAIYLIAILISVSLASALWMFEQWYLKLEPKFVLSMITVLTLMIVAVIMGQRGIADFVDSIRYAEDVKVYEKFLQTPGNLTLEESIILNRKWARDEHRNLIVPNCHPNPSKNGFCEFDSSQLTGSTLKMLIIGDSYASNVGPLVYKTFKKHAKQMSMYSVSDKDARYLEEIAKYQPDVLFIMEKPSTLTVHEPISEDPIFLEALRTLESYQKLVKLKIYILEAITPPTTPSLTEFADLLEEGVKVSQTTFKSDLSYKNGLRRQEELVKRCPKCQLIPISHVFHQERFTKSYNEATKLGYFYDGLHLTPSGLNMISPVFQIVSDGFKVTK